MTEHYGDCDIML